MSKEQNTEVKNSNEKPEGEFPFWIPLPFLELLEIAMRLRRCIRCGEAPELERRDIFLGKSFCAQCVSEFHESGVHFPRLVGDSPDGERNVELISVSV